MIHWDENEKNVQFEKKQHFFFLREMKKAKEPLINPLCTYFQKYNAEHILTQIYITIENEKYRKYSLRAYYKKYNKASDFTPTYMGLNSQ